MADRHAGQVCGATVWTTKQTPHWLPLVRAGGIVGNDASMTMVRLVLAALGVAASAAVAAAAPRDVAHKAIAEKMLKLSPEARVEQRCNARALGVVGREHPNLHPDEIIAYAFVETSLKGGKIAAPGAAIRSQGVWYKLSYVCQTENDGLSIASFSYTLGGIVPRSQWAEHYLVPP